MRYTGKQLETMSTIAHLTAARKLVPTLAEIASVMRVSTITVYEHILALEQKGALRRGPKGTQRSMELLDPEFLPASDAALYRAALDRLAKLTGSDTGTLDADIRSSLAAAPPAPGVD